jgi:LmbE family N-acetylglucosaminyl deacetylase
VQIPGPRFIHTETAQSPIWLSPGRSAPAGGVQGEKLDMYLISAIHRPFVCRAGARLGQPCRAPLGVIMALALGASFDARAQSSPAAPLDAVIVAHQDDWQLFMGDVIGRRAQAGHRVVFIYLTAGDDGRDSAYWTTRERGALRSTRIAANAAAAGDSSADQCSIVRVLDHAIKKCTIANTESYFLRLPDGHRNGTGFARHSYQSLRKLRRERMTSISAVDGSASYNGWGDLKSTVDSLIGESSATRVITVHTSDPSVVINPHDHFDHRMAGLLVYDSRRKNKWNVAYYAGYALATRAPNRTGEQVRQKTSLFRAYDDVMRQANPKWSAYRERPVFYSQCMMRTYGRRILFSPVKDMR